MPVVAVEPVQLHFGKQDPSRLRRLAQELEAQSSADRARSSVGTDDGARSKLSTVLEDDGDAAVLDELGHPAVLLDCDAEIGQARRHLRVRSVVAPRAVPSGSIPRWAAVGTGSGCLPSWRRALGTAR